VTGRPLGDANGDTGLGSSRRCADSRQAVSVATVGRVAVRSGEVCSRMSGRHRSGGTAGGAAHVRAATQAGGLTVGTPVGSMAKDYGPCVEKAGFKKVSGSPSPTHESGDVAVIQPVTKAGAVHMCMDDGTQWVSDLAALVTLSVPRLQKWQDGLCHLSIFGSHRRPCQADNVRCREADAMEPRAARSATLTSPKRP
jgi:hypothetical protein